MPQPLDSVPYADPRSVTLLVERKNLNKNWIFPIWKLSPYFSCYNIPDFHRSFSGHFKTADLKRQQWMNLMIAGSSLFWNEEVSFLCGHRFCSPWELLCHQISTHSGLLTKRKVAAERRDSRVLPSSWCQFWSWLF